MTFFPSNFNTNIWKEEACEVLRDHCFHGFLLNAEERTVIRLYWFRSACLCPLLPLHLDYGYGCMGIVDTFNIPKHTHLFDYYKHLETRVCTQKCYNYDKTEFASTCETPFWVRLLLFGGVCGFADSFPCLFCSCNSMLILNFMNSKVTKNSCSCSPQTLTFI